MKNSFSLKKKKPKEIDILIVKIKNVAGHVHVQVLQYHLMTIL